MTTAIVITGHGDFPLGLKSSLEMLIGDVSELHFVCFNTDFESYKVKLTSLLLELSHAFTKVIVFTDLAGGSPFNTSALVCKQVANLTVIGGSNLPMIVDTVTNVKYNIGEVSGDLIVATGVESIIAFKGLSKLKDEPLISEGI